MNLCIHYCLQLIQTKLFFISITDGLDENICNIKKQCQQQNVPYLFSLRRRQLAYTLFKKAPIGCVAVLDFDGAREIYLKLLQELDIARKSYEDLTNARSSEIKL